MDTDVGVCVLGVETREAAARDTLAYCGGLSPHNKENLSFEKKD